MKILKCKVGFDEKNIDGCTLDLPASKSISNRIVMICKLSGSDFSDLHNLSDCDDTRAMKSAIESHEVKIDIGAAGTAMRFLTSYFSIRPGENHILYGSERMKKRPIEDLVKALSGLGADIKYMEKMGYPPLFIRGKNLDGGFVKMNADVSSQYISSLMMIAPCLNNGLKIILDNRPVSLPYLAMTKSLMEIFGVEVLFDGRVFHILPQRYIAREYSVENDWSAASYWYEVLFLYARKCSVFLKGLHKDSLQGDAAVAGIYEKLGLSTRYERGGILVSWERTVPLDFFSFDFKDCPDLAQTLVVSCVLKGVHFRFSGLESLKIKETDRIAALRRELLRLGYVLEEPESGCLLWNGSKRVPECDPSISTYKDHRMAMSFAPLAILKHEILIEDPVVVTKSYPSFWKDMRAFGFTVEFD